MPIKLKRDKKLIGVFKSYVDMAEYIEKHHLIGEFFAIPTNFKKLSAIRKVVADGAFVHVENYGYV